MVIGVGIIGLGDGGLCHARALLGSQASVSAVSDIRAERRESVYRDLKSQYWRDLHFSSNAKDVITRSDVDVVVVATPDHEHVPVTELALKLGKFVFLDKPAATSFPDLTTLRRLSYDYPGRVIFSEKYSFSRLVTKTLRFRSQLGRFLYGDTIYVMENCDRIMGSGKWRTEQAYNPCAGGLTHNFMTAALLIGAPITRIRADGQVNTYHRNLAHYGGYDTMGGSIEFANGERINWMVGLSLRSKNGLYGHRTVAHNFQFEHGALAYGSRPECDRLIVRGQDIAFLPEPSENEWSSYNLGLYRAMHNDTVRAMENLPTVHSIWQGINVAAASVCAFSSAKAEGRWMPIPQQFIFH